MKRSLVKDDWIIGLASATVLCGFLSISNHWKDLPFGKSAAVQAPELSNEVPKIEDLKLKNLEVVAKTSLEAGKWVVDMQKGPNSDTADLKEAIDHAKAGDTIVVRQGVYKGNFSINRNLKIIGESNIPGAKPQLNADKDLPIMALANANVEITNFNFVYEGNNFTPLLVSTQSEVSLKDCNFESKPTNVSLIDSANSILSLDNVFGLRAKSALISKNDQKVDIKNSKFEAQMVESLSFSSSQNVELSNVKIESNGSGIRINKTPGLVANNVEISSMTAVPEPIDDGAVEGLGNHLKNFEVEDPNRWGIYLEAHSIAEFKNIQIQNFSNAGIGVENDVMLTIRNGVFTQNKIGIKALGPFMLQMEDTQLQSKESDFAFPIGIKVQYFGKNNSPEPRQADWR